MICAKLEELTTRKKVIILILSLGLLSCGAILGWLAFPLIIHQIVKNATGLDNKETFERWKTIPFPIEFKVYLFNVTNPEEVRNGFPPVVEEVGPFIYDEYITREIKENRRETIMYLKTNHYFFNSEKSFPLDENDIVTIFNVALLGMAGTMERISPFAIDFLNDAIPVMFPGSNKLFITAPVKDILFGDINLYCRKESEELCLAMQFKKTVTLEFDEKDSAFKFSFFKHKNQSSEGPYEMDKGTKDILKLGELISYKGINHLTTWTPQNSTCNILRGTDSTIFHPFHEIKDNLHIFSPDICLSIPAIFEKEVFQGGLKLHKYISDPKNFKLSVENECRCPRDDYLEPHSKPLCPLEGLIDLIPCQGAPILISQPHFYKADPILLNYTQGLKPEKDKHETFVLMDLLTGTPVAGKKRIQMNILLTAYDGIDLLSNITNEGVVPLLWLEEGAVLDDEILKPLRFLNTIILIFDVFKWLILTAGALALLTPIGIHLQVRGWKKNKNSQVIYNNQSVKIVDTIEKSRTDEFHKQGATKNGSSEVNNLEDVVTHVESLYPRYEDSHRQTVPR